MSDQPVRVRRILALRLPEFTDQDVVVMTYGGGCGKLLADGAVEWVEPPLSDADARTRLTVSWPEVGELLACCVPDIMMPFRLVIGTMWSALDLGWVPSPPITTDAAMAPFPETPRFRYESTMESVLQSQTSGGGRFVTFTGTFMRRADTAALTKGGGFGVQVDGEIRWHPTAVPDDVEHTVLVPASMLELILSTSTLPIRPLDAVARAIWPVACEVYGLANDGSSVH